MWFYSSIQTVKQKEINHKNASYIHDFFVESKSYRDTFHDNVTSDFIKLYTLFVDVKDQPGSIATIATLLSSRQINIRDIGIVNHREFEPGIMRIVFSTTRDRINANEVLSYHNYTVYY